MSDDNVIRPSFVTKRDLDPEIVLTGAIGEVNECIVVGWSDDGSFYIAASNGDLDRLNLLLDRAKFDVMQRLIAMEPHDDE